MSDTRQKTLSFFGILGAFLVVAFLVWAMKYYTRPAPLNAARAEERRKALVELRAANEDGLTRYGWVDQAKGLVRLRIDRAMELTIEEYKNPAAARSNLMARAAAAESSAGTAPAEQVRIAVDDPVFSIVVRDAGPRSRDAPVAGRN